jgi:hypothetical protein
VFLKTKSPPAKAGKLFLSVPGAGIAFGESLCVIVKEETKPLRVCFFIAILLF